ncbi:MAG: hypothetical protein Q9174_004172, partial [Haloplaca sp. 1 TL-2023]
MPSLSFIKALPLLLITLPSLIVSTPTPGPQAADAPETDIKPLGRYNISAAEILSRDRTDPAGVTLGKDNTLNVTVSGSQPGNIDNTCVGNWFWDNTQEVSGTTIFECTDSALQLALSQFKQEDTIVEFSLFITYP